MSASTRAALAISPGVLLAGIAGGIAFPILPAVGLRTGIALPLIGAILAANRFGRIVAGPLVGLAADRFAAKRLLLLGLLTQVAVMALYLLGVRTSHPAAFFLAGRLLHGPGSACVFVAAQTLALQTGGREHGGFASGLIRASTSIGLPLGVVLGGVIAGRFGEAAAFEGAILALVGALAAAFVGAPESSRAPAARAPLKAVLAALGNRQMLALGALNFAVTFSALGVVLTTLPLVLGTKGGSAGLMGWMVVAMGGSTLAASRFIRRRVGHARACLAATVVLGPALAAIGLASGAGGTLLAVTVLGIAAGTLSASVVCLLTLSVEPLHLGAASGWLQLCGDLGGVAGPLCGASLLAFGNSVPGVCCGAMLICFTPIALWLLGSESAASANTVRGAFVALRGTHETVLARLSDPRDVAR